MSVVFIDLNNPGDGKMSNCKFRSKSKVNQEEKLCCGRKRMMFEFKCEKRNIFPLKPNICESCNEYEKLD